MAIKTTACNHCGYRLLSAWKLVFAYVSGLIAYCSSANKITEHCSKSPIIREILAGVSLSQKIESIWQDLMKRYLSLSDDPEHITAPNSGHYIHLTDLEVLLKVVESFIE